MDINSDKAIEENNIIEFLNEVIQRGLGIYGKEKMVQICYNSDIELLDDYSIKWLSTDHNKSINVLIENYSSINLPAKMTIMILIKKYQIPFSNSFDKKTRKSRFLKIFGR